MRTIAICLALLLFALLLPERAEARKKNQFTLPRPVAKPPVYKRHNPKQKPKFSVRYPNQR